MSRSLYLKIMKSSMKPTFLTKTQCLNKSPTMATNKQNPPRKTIRFQTKTLKTTRTKNL